MALLGGGTRLKMLGSFTSRNSANYATGVHQANGIGALNQARARNFSLGDADIFERTEQAGIPYGARPPYCWALPQINGAIKSYKSGNISINGSADMQLGQPFSADGGLVIDGTAALDIVLSIVASGNISMNGSIVLSNIIGVTSNGSYDISGSASLDRLVSIIVSGDVSMNGAANIMQLQSFTATDAVVSGSTQEIIDGVVAGLAGQTGLTPIQESWLREVWQKEGLDPDQIVTVTKNSIKIGDPLNPIITILLTGDLKNITTLARQ